MNNDERILELQEKIALKRTELGDEPEFKPLTDGLMKTGTGMTANLHTAPEDVSVSLLIDLNARRMSAENLDIPYKIGGYPVDDWILDIQAHLVCLEYKREQQRLGSLERELDRLLSEEEKKARRVSEIAEKI